MRGVLQKKHLSSDDALYGAHKAELLPYYTPRPPCAELPGGLQRNDGRKKRREINPCQIITYLEYYFTYLYHLKRPLQTFEETSLQCLHYYYY